VGVADELPGRSEQSFFGKQEKPGIGIKNRIQCTGTRDIGVNGESGYIRHICKIRKSYRNFAPMAEDLQLIQGTKTEQYAALLPQIRALMEGESDGTANLANVAAALKEQFGWLWVGFYLIKAEELVVGPFQGPVACTRIRKGKGVCGTSWAEERTLIVPDVEAFPGHIACSSLSRSEIVVPVRAGTKIVGVLDVDSVELNAFDEEDQRWLEEVVKIIPGVNA
jgi:GAF domain-containing protein